MRTLYIAYLGMRARQRTLDVTANNIANASTTGFKADRIFHRAFEAAEIEAKRAQSSGNQLANGAPASDPGRNPGVTAGGAPDYLTGVIRQTGRSLDVALNGEGFLVVQTPRGERYTRAGTLTLDASGQLVTQNGALVVGQSGAITVPPGEVTIGEDGEISVQGRAVDRLRLVRFADQRAALLKEGDSLFVTADGTQPVEDNQTRVVQGALEMSNVNTIVEMAAMIKNEREFEALQRAITMKLQGANEIGRL